MNLHVCQPSRIFFISCIICHVAFAIPPYTRGPVPNWMIPVASRENGIAYLGAHHRLRVAVEEMQNGSSPFLVSVVGGSNTVGHGAINGFAWPRYLFNWLTDAFPNRNITMHNGAVAGAMSEYISLCNGIHIPLESNMIILEYSHNDEHAPLPLFDNHVRRSFERLLRKLLDYPKRPAILLLHTYAWHETSDPKGKYWGNAERELGEIGLYYSLPAVSVRGCCYHLMRKNVSGFRVDHARRIPEMFEVLKFETWYSDGVHAAGDTGYRGMAELLIHLLMKVSTGFKTMPLSPTDVGAAQEDLPPPMIPGNLPTTKDVCFIGEVLRKCALSPLNEGWSWVDDAINHPGRQPKLGFSSKTVGAAITFVVDTRRHGGLIKHSDGPTSDVEPTVTLGIAHLRSYEHMGQASIACSNNCTCKGDLMLEGMQERKVSQRHIHSLQVNQVDACRITITVLPTTKSDGHSVKIQGMFVSEEARNDNMARVITTGVLDSMADTRGIQI
ncbi:hypothetical protein CEUSTIGMA_g15.t1 [Chlamydomonas eustigma]|uniref:SGNH hydrolase-type esterase domain-containing protein n=1 Tax=Chlamydomonas eustigma TaxID=1157962 RepID=A0A250WPE4_9CHLO|nr:hypothetical protein CEUSTIGMA_g15.t1 [Chlamydomonas eustigma]|eukprot:GAX72559.1 hypothetical protein CEUSTIGMA_g15.t1 [Chlamydomonas eustigma]